jgi:hypothetical protein
VEDDIRRHVLLLGEAASALSKGLPQRDVDIIWQWRASLAFRSFLFHVSAQLYALFTAQQGAAALFELKRAKAFEVDAEKPSGD